jgi:hypothetical protein
MITLLLDLLAINSFCGYLGTRQQVKALKAAKARAEVFQRWAAKNPHHALTQRVECELLEIQQNLRMTKTEKAWACVTVAENAYTLMLEVQQGLKARQALEAHAKMMATPPTCSFGGEAWSAEQMTERAENRMDDLGQGRIELARLLAKERNSE